MEFNNNVDQNVAADIAANTAAARAAYTAGQTCDAKQHHWQCGDIRRPKYKQGLAASAIFDNVKQASYHRQLSLSVPMRICTQDNLAYAA